MGVDIRDQWDIAQEWSESRRGRYGECISHIKKAVSIATEITSEISKKTITQLDENEIPQDEDKFFDNKINATSYRAISFIKAGAINFENGGPISPNDALNRMISENILLVRYLLRNRGAVPDWIKFRKLKDFNKAIPKEFRKKIDTDYRMFSFTFLLKRLYEEKRFSTEVIRIYEADKAYLDAQVHPSDTGFASDRTNTQKRNDRIVHRNCQFLPEWFDALTPLVEKYSINSELCALLKSEFALLKEYEKNWRDSFLQPES